MLTKNSIKRISSLQLKKFRNQTNCFLAEGPRLVDEILVSNLKVNELYYTPLWNNSNLNKCGQSTEITTDEMKKISLLSTPTSVLAVVETPYYTVEDAELNNKLTLALDYVQDPGNLGTIIRLADWFGIDHILCSNSTADAFSPKVVQASMGAITRVKIVYCNLVEKLEQLRKQMPIYGTFMEGKNIYSADIKPNGIVVMGNEGNGISHEVEQLVTNRIHIPSFASKRGNVESLNVATATAVICSEFCRRR